VTMNCDLTVNVLHFKSTFNLLCAPERQGQLQLMTDSEIKRCKTFGKVIIPGQVLKRGLHLVTWPTLLSMCSTD